MRSVTALTSLTFEAGDYGRPLIDRHNVPYRISQATSHHAKTLTELNIVCPEAGADSQSTVFGSLMGYPNLRILAIPKTYLTSPTDTHFHDLFPPSLERLQLQCPGWYHPDNRDTLRPLRIRKLQQTAEGKDRLLPSLKQVIWWDQTPEGYPDIQFGCEHEQNLLVEVFKENDVTFQIDRAPYWEESPFGEPDVTEDVSTYFLRKHGKLAKAG